MCAWTPEGLNGQMLKLMGSALPTPPPDVQPSILWGTEEHVRELFAGKGVELEFERVMAIWEFPSADAWVTQLENNLGPTILAKSLLEPAGEWEAMRARSRGALRDLRHAGRGLPPGGGVPADRGAAHGLASLDHVFHTRYAGLSRVALPGLASPVGEPEHEGQERSC